MKASLWTLINDDPRFNLQSGDVLVCVPYEYDPAKLIVITRLSDGYRPECTVYRYEVRPAFDAEVFA